MKKLNAPLTAFIVTVIGSSIYSQHSNAQTINIAENPVAYKYLLKHFELKGKVKSVTTNGANNYLMTTDLFDTAGRVTSMTNFSGIAYKSNYTYHNNLIKISQQSAGLSPINYLFQCNKNQDVEFSLYKEGDPLRQFEYKGILLIKDSSANKYSTQKAYYSYYQYNTKGQLITLKDFNGGGKLNREEVYTYNGNTVTINGKTFVSGNTNEYEKKKYYDAKGSLIKSTFAQNGKTETTEYKLDANGNWIWKTGDVTRRIEYYETPAATTAAAVKPGGNDNKAQLPVFIDENYDDNKRKWAEWNNEGSAAQLLNGNYRVTVKDNKNYACWLIVPDMADQSRDFAIETKILLHSTDAGNSNDSYWLLWGVGNGAKDFYTFGIYPSGKFQYGKQVNGQWDGKAGAIASAAVKAGVNKANVLRVEKRQHEIFFFVNGIEVYKTNYETFDKNYTGVGFQWNNKKLLDIDYLKIYRGTVSNAAKSPEPHETNYQKKLAGANNSAERANALIDYYLAVKPITPSAEQLESLLSQKFLQMMDIDYHGYYEMVLSKRISAADVKLCMKASEVLTTAQRSAIKLLAQYTVDSYVAREKNSTTPAYPTGVPLPGYGWGKTVSSNKAIMPPAVYTAPVADELTTLKSNAINIEGSMVFLRGKNWFVPGYINVTNLNDEVTLTAIGAKYTYSSYYSKSVFGITSLKNVTTTIKVRELIRMINNVSGAYIVTEVGPCGKCSGQASSWDNQSRTRTNCSSCDATGCVPTFIMNNGSSRRY